MVYIYKNLIRSTITIFNNLSHPYHSTSVKQRYYLPCPSTDFHTMQLLGFHKHFTLQSINPDVSLSTQPSSPSNGSPTSDESTSLQLEISHGPANGCPNQPVLPAWVSSLRFLLRDRSIPAYKLQELKLLAAPITTEKMHRDLVEWSARVASIDRELRSLPRDMMDEGIGLEEVLVAIEEEQDVQVVRRLWS